MSNDILYFNARISTEGASAQTNPSFDAKFAVNLPNALLERSSDWKMSIIRFSSTLHGLPALFVAHPAQVGVQPTNTKYTFSLSYGASVVTETVKWSPADPNAYQTIDGYGDSYWYEYNYVRFGTFLNKALSDAMAALIILQVGLVGVPAPFFSYNETSAVWNLYTPVEFLDSATTPIHIYQNEDCHFLLSGFPTAPTGILGQDERILILQQGDELDFTIAGHQFISRAQLPGSLTTWSPVKRFVFTTGSMPVVSEIIVPQTAYNPNAAQPSVSYSSQKVITDITPSMSRGDELINGSIEYSPTAQYRYTNLNGGGLTAIDFSINWEDPIGSLHLMQLKHGGSASCKFYFERKLN